MEALEEAKKYLDMIYEKMQQAENIAKAERN